MVGGIFVVILFILVVSACCFSDGESSKNTAPKRNVSNNGGTYRGGQNAYRPSYCECPSCGAPYFDGYCEECGYPDFNQGWVGENY